MAQMTEAQKQRKRGIEAGITAMFEFAESIELADPAAAREAMQEAERYMEMARSEFAASLSP